MSSLGPQQQNQSYSGLLQVPGGVTNVLKTVQDGDGNPTGLQISSLGTNAATADSFVASDFGTPITGAVPRLISDGFGDIVNVKDFGALGDGATDDTAAIQLALNSGATTINFANGTYLINGGLVLNNANTTLNCTGATIKLKNSAANKGMLRINGAGCTVIGGIWDGNKANGNTPASIYSSWNFGVFGSRCTIKDCYSINTYGMCATGGSVSDTLFQSNTIRNTTVYGLFLATAVNAYRNRAIGNNIDMSEGGVFGQGILFTRTGSVLQYDWEISSNTIIGSQDPAITDQAINLAVRGVKGVVANNITRYGAMGWSEGGADTVITGNSFLDLVGSVRYGIEVSGANTVVSGNIVTNAIYGVIVSGNVNYDNLCITGNRITANNGIRLQIAVGYTGKNISITGNNIVAGIRGVYTARNITNLTVSSNVMIGPGSAVNGSRGIYSEGPEQDAYIFVQGNTIVGFQRALAVYNATALAINKLYAIANNMANDNTSPSRFWNFEGLATPGVDVISAWNTSNLGLRVNYLDNAIQYNIGTGSPEGVTTASVGSLYLRSNGGAGSTLYVKETGTGATGWVAK